MKRRPPSSGSSTVEESVDEVVGPILSELAENNLPRTIMFMPLKWCGYVHSRALLEYLEHIEAPDDGWVTLTQEDGSEEVIALKTLVAQYHAPQTAEVRFF